jgi:molecular chaperone DnaK
MARARVSWSGSGGVQRHLVRDLSARGMFVVTKVSPSLGREVRFELFGSAEGGAENAIVGQARIVWISPGQGAALEFIGLTLSAAQLVALGQQDTQRKRSARRVSSRKLAQHQGSLGIDFGASQVRAATLSNSRPKMLEFRDSSTMQSAICALSDAGSLVTGREAVELRLLAPASAIQLAKRLLGRAYLPERAARWRQHVGVSLVAGPDQRCAARMRTNEVERVVSVQEAVTACFADLRHTAEARLGALTSSAIVGAPCYFDAAQRHALLCAARAAGFGAARLVSEPIAAAVAYAAGRSLSQLVLVVDVGAASTQVAVVEMRGHQLVVLSAAGNDVLGGFEFDERIAMHLLERFRARNRFTPKLTTQQGTRLLWAAEQAKLALSFQASYVSTLPHFVQAEGADSEMRIELDVLAVDALCRPLIDQIVILVDTVLREALVSACEVDEFLLVGGMTRMPALQRVLSEAVGKKPNSRVSPDEAVARGLAWLGDPVSVAAPLLCETLTQPIKTPAGTALVEVLPAGTPWPVKRTVMLHSDGGPALQVHLFQGRGTQAADCEYLATVRIQTLAQPTAGNAYDVCLELNDDGVLAASASLVDAGHSVPCVIDYQLAPPKL